jgi:V8-like Glu-specific endopeptidase
VFDPMFVSPPDLLRTTSASVLGDAAEGDAYSLMLESICGTTDDSQPVEQYDGTLGVTRAFVDSHQSAAAQVQWNDDLASKYTNPGNVNGVRWGSGTMIGPDLFLTCGHLFDQTGNGWTRPVANGTSQTISPQEIATNMHLNFNYQVDSAGSLRTEERFPITQLIEFRLGGIDMAVCRIGGDPGATHGRTGVGTADVAVGAMLAIIGHPAGQPKRIEAGPATALSPGQLSYNDIDTLGGNSGSGILGPAGTLVGVHTNGGCNSAGTGSNFGVPISAIRAVSPTLQNLVTNPILDNIVTTRPALDNIVTLARFDDITPTTRPWLDTVPAFDAIVSVPWVDVIVTAPWADVGGTGPAVDTIREGIDPGGWSDPVVNPPVGQGAVGAGGLRPFALQGGHRFAAGEAAQYSEADQKQALEQMLAQYEEALGAVRAQLASLEAEYSEAYATYAETYGASG